MKINAFGAALVGILAAAQAQAVTVTGSLSFNGGAYNYYDPQQQTGYTPFGYGNYWNKTVTVGQGIEFGFNDTVSLDTVDFSDLGVVLRNDSPTNAVSWVQTFTASDANYFTGMSLVSSDFAPSLNWSVKGDTLRISWDGAATAGLRTAAFALAGPAAVPEPASWAMLVTGFGVMGMSLRRRQRARLVRA